MDAQYVTPMNHERTSPQPARVSRWRRIFLAAMAASLMLPSTSYAQLGIPSVPGIPGVGGLGGAAAGLGGLGGGASAAPQTLWRFLGFKGGSRFKALRDALVNRRGNFPGLEKKPMIKSLTDPSNMQSDNPAIKKAAETKSQADAAPQKVKALKYLATVGCDKCNPGVKEALMAALDDCTEEVRFEGAKALRAVAGDKCNACRKTCCDKQLTDKLFDVAFGRDEACCYKETSARVRKMARQALCACATPGTGSNPPPATEGPKGDPDEVKPEDATKGTVAQTSGVVDPVELAAAHREQKTSTSSKQMISALFAAPGVSGSRDGREKIVPQQIRSISPRERSQAYRTPLAVTVHTSTGVERAVAQEPAVVREPVVSRIPPVAREAAGAASIHSAGPSFADPSIVPAAPAVTHANIVDSAPAVPGDAGMPSQVQQTAGPWSGRPGSGVDLTERAAAQRRFEAETARGAVPEQINPNDPNSVPGSPLQRITRPINNLIKQQQELPDEEYFLPGGRKFKPHQPAASPPPRIPNQPSPAETVRKGPRAKPAPMPTPAPTPVETLPEEIPEPVLVRKVKPKAVETEEEPEEEAPVPGEVSKWLAKKPSKADSQNSPGQLTGRLKLFSSGSVPAEETALTNTPDLAEVLPGSKTAPALQDEVQGPSFAPAPVVTRTPSPKPVVEDASAEEAPMPMPVVRRVKPGAGADAPTPVYSVDPEFATAPAKPSKAPAKTPEPKPTAAHAPAAEDADLADAPLPGALPKVAATKKPGTIEPTIRAAEVATSPSGIPIEVTKEAPAPQMVAAPKAAPVVAAPKIVGEPKMPVLVPRRRPVELEAPLPGAIPVASTPAPEPKTLPKHAAPEVPAAKGPKSPSIVLKPFQPEEESEEMEQPEPAVRTAAPAPARTPEFAGNDAEPAVSQAESADAEAPLPPNLSAAKLAGVVQRGPATVAPRTIARETAVAPAPAAPAAEIAPKAEITPEPEEIVHTPITLPETPRVVARPKGPLVVLPGKSFRKEFEGDESESKQPIKAATRQGSTPIQLPGADLATVEPKAVSAEITPSASAKAPFQLPGADLVEPAEAPIQLPNASESSQPAGVKKGPKLFPIVPSKGTPMRLPGADLPETAEPMPPASAPMILPGAAPLRRELPTPDAPSPSPITLPGQSSNLKGKNRQAAIDGKPIKLGGMTIFLREMPIQETRDRDEELAIGSASEIQTVSATAETPVILQPSHIVTSQSPVDSQPAPARGRVQAVRMADGLVELSFAGPKPAKGTRLSLVRSYPTENVYLGDVEVVESGDRVLARPTHWLPVQRISSGDQVCGEGDPLLAPVESSVAPAVFESR